MAVAPSAALAWAYVMAASGSLEAVWTERLWQAALMEFFAIHASGFLLVVHAFDWPRERRLKIVSAVAVGYTAATGGIGLVTGSAWPVATFWILIANHVLGALAVASAGEPPDHHAAFNARIGYPWAGAVVLFVICAAGAGLAGAARPAVLWAGAAYFGLLALSEVTSWSWVHRWMRGAGARASRGSRRRSSPGK